MKTKYFVTVLLIAILVVGNVLNVSAAEISGNDANYGIMMLSKDYGIATAGIYLPNTVADGSVSFWFQPSFSADTQIVSIDLFKIGFNSDEHYSVSNGFRLLGDINISNITNGMNLIKSELWITLDGEKQYLTNFASNWYDYFTSFTFSDQGTQVGIDLEFSPIYDNLTGYNDFRYDSNTGLGSYESAPDRALVSDKIIISWSGIEWDIFPMHNNVTTRIDNILSFLNNWSSVLNLHLSNLFNDLTSFLTNKFDQLFQKIDDDQEEIINGYDPGTGDTANDNFNQSADELHAVEGDLFNSASYDKVDYSSYNGFFEITGVAGAMLFVSSTLESFYTALGIFATPLTIGLILLIITRILGFQNLSSGGG